MNQSNNRKIVLLIFSIVSFCNYLLAQEDKLINVYGRSEITAELGANNFLGDLGGNIGKGGPFLKDFTFKTIKPLAGFSYAYYPQNWYQLKIGFNFSSVTGADSLISATGDLARWRIYRNLSFKSSIFEAYAVGQFYPLTFFTPGYGMRRLNPFIEAGIGVFHFNPQSQLNGEWINLQPLHLEGEGFTEYADRKPYKLTQLYLPVSAGFKYYLNNRFSASGGITFRKTFTDYIDDISTTYIDPSLFDKYLSADQALLAKQLYSRSLRPDKVKPGIVKANSSNKDTYVTIFVSISMYLDKYIPFYYGGSMRRRDGSLSY